MSVYKRGNWWHISASWKGERVRRSTPATCRTEAKRYEATAILQLQSGVPAADVELDQKKAADKQKWTLQACLDRCLREVWADKKSVDSYHRPVGGSMVRRIGPNREVKSITVDDLLALKALTTTNEIRPATYNRYLQILNTMLSWSREWEKPLPKVKPLRYRLEEQERYRILADAEEEPLMQGARQVSEEYRDFLIVALESGWRSSEGCRLLVQDVDLEQGHMTVFDGKSGSRGVWLNKKATEALSRQKARAIERGTSRMWQYSKDRCVELFGDAKANAGIKDPDLTAHCLRHTKATRLILRGVDVTQVAQWLGHRNLETTRKYAKIYGTHLKHIRDDMEEE